MSDGMNRRLGGSCMGAALLAPLIALAQATSAGQAETGAEARPVVLFSVGAAVSRDSNIFRLSDSADPVAVLGTSDKSDTITSVSAGIDIDKRFSLQRFRLSAGATAYRHANFSRLDFNALDYDGAWDWQVGRHINGTVSASRSQALANYADFRDPNLRNVVTTDRRRLSLDGWLTGGWHLLLGASRDESRNSVVFVQEGSYRAVGANAGLKYVTLAGNSVAFISESTSADYIDRQLDPANLIDDGFKRTDNYLAVTWMPTVKSSLNASAGWTDYRSNNFSQRDFSGSVAQLGYRWQATAKLSLALSAARTRTPYIDRYASYVVTDTVSFSPLWQLSRKVALSADLSRATGDYQGNVVALTGPARSDDLSSARAGVAWTPRRGLTVKASVQHERRRSNFAGLDYRDNVATLSATLLF